MRTFFRRTSLFLVPVTLLMTPAEPTWAKDVTYYDDIENLLSKNCTSCHRPGESAPFSLMTYEEVSKKATTLLRVISDGYMPPWHAGPGSYEFLDKRELSAEDIALYRAWIEGGKLEGQKKNTEKDLVASGPQWRLGEPDLIVSMEKAYPVPADGPDIYRNFVLPLNLSEDKWVKAIELRPSARSVVHHSLFFLDESGTARRLDGKDGKPGFKGMSFRKSGSLGGYVPGTTPRKLPGDLARPLPQKSDLILSTHFHPSGKAESEKTMVGIYFAEQAPSRTLREIQIPPGFGRSAGINIPAGEENYVIEDTFTFPSDAEAVCVSGHAHYVCKSMKLTADFPDGQVKTILDIPDWDLDWQDTYYFKEKVILPKGTVIKSVIAYDNSAANPNNPFSPPKRIKWGRESTDEMGSMTLTVVPADAGNDVRLRVANAMNQAKLFKQLGDELRKAKVLERLPQIVAGLDKDQDGKLSKEELPARLRVALLSRLDDNQDEVLDAAEMETLRLWLQSLKDSEENSSI